MLKYVSVRNVKTKSTISKVLKEFYEHTPTSIIPMRS